MSETTCPLEGHILQELLTFQAKEKYERPKLLENASSVCLILSVVKADACCGVP